ncbi:hypothetical protein [Sulfuricystis multivorans]|uniref:hypothetical protein n=1 Tax=Sulfuricystis multivorans TaxID=2211108 RepID=UPI000F824B1E|nr:hypothetical protein [Sulfuricystis multivorans]
MKPKQIALIAALSTTALSAVAAGPGRFAWNKDYTPGWTLMTPEERSEWANKMREVKTYEECKALQEEHHKAMEERAKEKGVKLMPPRQNGCDVMKARGFIK